MGDDDFMSELEPFLKGTKEVREIPRRQRFGGVLWVRGVICGYWINPTW